MKLNLGCGTIHLDGYVNVDISQKANVDIICDIEHLDREFIPESVDEIYSYHAIEHLSDYEEGMLQIWQVLKPGGKAIIIVPYGSNSANFHPEHKAYFSYVSMLSFKKCHDYSYYHKVTFTDVSIKLIFGKTTGFLFGRIFNRFTALYETTMLSHLFPAFELRIEMIK